MDFDPGPTTLLYLAYRLRIKANYDEMDLYISQSSEREILEFDSYLTSFCQYTMIVFEIILARKITKETLTEFAKDYLRSNPLAKKLESRIKLYSKLHDH